MKQSTENNIWCVLMVYLRGERLTVSFFSSSFFFNRIIYATCFFPSSFVFFPVCVYSIYVYTYTYRIQLTAQTNGPLYICFNCSTRTYLLSWANIWIDLKSLDTNRHKTTTAKTKIEYWSQKEKRLSKGISMRCLRFYTLWFNSIFVVLPDLVVAP